ncbi:MAG TPA: uroporphyrinogen-III synthase [Steroidobacteraceae bacterium]|jgi:uroporphyrinogen-III synthase|nr:uroporphyrinogen-III synthase [Steroidobacteraceae bacterium]
MIDWNLQGKTIAVPEMRELEVFSALLERRGAKVLRCPLVTIYDSPHSAQVLAFAVKLADGGFDDFVLITGEGLTRILSCIDKYEPALRSRFIEGLGKLRTITRGPKPARALRVLGLKPGIEATEPTTDGVIRSLSTHALEGRRMAVQLYGNDPNLTLMRFLRERNALTTTVAPYVYGNAADDSTVQALLERMAAGEVDAIAFTSKLQIERLVTQHPAALVRRALSRTKIAAVGPIVAEAIRAAGYEVASSPEHSWFMKPLVVALSEQLGAKKDKDLSGLA